MKSPLLTIIMASYNYAHFLHQAIESILNQSFTNFEFLIFEDGSTDGSAAIIREYMSKDERIKATFYEKNKGMLERVNEGFIQARGTYIHYFAADDFRYPGFLEKVMSTLTKDPTLGLVYTQFYYGNDTELLLETCGFEKSESPLIFSPDTIASIFLNYNLKFFTVSAIFKKQLVEENNGFDPKLYYYSDWYLLTRIAFTNKIGLICEPLSHFRIHDKNFSNIHRHHKKTKRSIYNHLLKKIDLPENRSYKEQLKKSALLSQVFQDLFWKLLLNPKYLSFWPYINKKYSIKGRIIKSLKKKLDI